MNQDLSGRNIRPADFQSPDQLDEQSAPRSVATPSPPLRAIITITLLFVVALATLILLPRQIRQPASEDALAGTVTEAPLLPAEQPFVDAQLLRARQQAQEILANLIELQNQLDGLSIELWASESYEAILALASSGDSAYQQRDFNAALSSYSQAEQAARELLEQRGAFAETAIEAANRAFAAGDAATATEKYNLALTLAPDSQVAQQGLSRSAVLDEVSELKGLAAVARSNNDWHATASLLEQVVALDPLDASAVDQLTAAQEEVRQIAYRENLAAGFNALANAQYNQARISFLRADQLVPGSSTVADALLQVESAVEVGQRGELWDEALIAESREDWELAAEHYRELLAKDTSNLEARINLIRVEARAGLNAKIEGILSDPIALQSDERWNEAEATLADARAIIDKTPRLVEQISELAMVIQQARTPVELQILSDGQTQIEIYRIGRLGTLRDHRVNMYPGEYTIIGRRSGYRDVRKELEIRGGTPSVTLRIEANEPVNR